MKYKVILLLLVLTACSSKNEEEQGFLYKYGISMERKSDYFKRYQYLWVSNKEEALLVDENGLVKIRLSKDEMIGLPDMINDSLYIYQENKEIHVLKHISGRVIRRDSIYGYFPIQRPSDYIGISNGARIGVLNAHGIEILPAVYEDIRQVGQSNKFWVLRDNNYYLVREDSIISENYKYGRVGVDGYIWAAKENSKYGFLDSTGREIISFIYDWIPQVNRFSEGLAPVILKGKLGFINLEGEIVIPHKYIAEMNHPELGGIINHFKGGRCLVEKESGEVVYIDKYGNEE